MIYADLPTNVTTVTPRLDQMLRTCLRQTTAIGTRCVSCVTCAKNRCDQTANSPSTRSRSFAMIVTSLISRRRAKVASTRSNQEARVWSTTGRTGTRSVSSAPSVKRLLGPAVSFQRMTSSTAQTAIKICMPNVAPTVGNRCPKVASSTTNKRGTKSVLAVTAATSPWRLAHFPFTVVTAIASSATEDT